jgi:hypothetical protein
MKQGPKDCTGEIFAT